MTETATCPRCGDPMSTDPDFVPSGSITEQDTDIVSDLCAACGHDEEMLDVAGEPLALRAGWPVKRQHQAPGS